MILKYTISITLSPVNENGAVLLRIRLSSTLQRRKRSPKTEPFENALQCGRRKRCYLKTVSSSKQTRPGERPLDREYPKWWTGATMWLQFLTNFAGRYIEMRMRPVLLSMHTEGIKAFSNLRGVVVWTEPQFSKT